MRKSILLNQKRILLSALMVIIALIISTASYSATYYSRRTGDWHTLSTWSFAIGGAQAGSIPGAGDDVVIDADMVTLSAGNISILSLHIESVGQIWGVRSAGIIISNGTKLTVTGNLSSLAVNKTVSQLIKLMDNNSELEIFGSLDISRTVDNVTEEENELIMVDASTLTLHGNLNINNRNSDYWLYQRDIQLQDNANFICKSNVSYTQSDPGYHNFRIDDYSNWQIDGNMTINQNGTDIFGISAYDYSTVTINQNVTVNSSNSAVTRFYFGGHNTVGVGSVFHIKGNFNFLHPSGGYIRLRAQQRGELFVDGDFNVSWTGSGSLNQSIEIEVYDVAKMNFKKSITINMTDPSGGIGFLVKGLGELIVGTNNGLLAESATINLNGGYSMITDLDSDAKFIVYGDLNQTCNGNGNLNVRLNEGVNMATGSALLNVYGNWNMNKTNGRDLKLSIKNNSQVIVQGNLSISSVDNSIDLNPVSEYVELYNNATLDVLGNFSFEVDDVDDVTVLGLKLYDNAKMTTGSNLGNSTSLIATNAKNILVNLYNSAQWNVNGDFNFNCLDISTTSSFVLANTSEFLVTRDLKIDNTSNSNSIDITANGTSLITVGRDIDFTNVLGQDRGLISVLTDSKLELSGSFIQNAAPNNYGAIKVLNNGVLEFNGMDAQVIPATASAGTDFTELGNVVLNSFSINVPQFSVNGDALMKSLTVKALNEINILSDVSLTVQNSITNNGVIHVENNASLIQTSAGANTNAGTGTYHVKRTGKNVATVFNVWSSPINSASLTSVFNGNNACDMYVFEPSVQNWSYDFAAGYSTTCNGNAVTFQAGNIIAGGDGVMDIARGYYIPGSANSTRTFSGSVNNGDINMAIEITALGNNPNWNDDDWNLVGNPYPSSLDATAFWTENAVNNVRITNSIYYWDDADPNAASNQNSDYAYWNLAGGVSSGNSNKIPNGHIASGQGFWVYANASTNLVFNNSMRSSTNDQFFKQENINHNAWISLTTPSLQENNILVGFNVNATDTIDQVFDAHKLPVNPHVYFASTYGTEDFVIQSLAPIPMGNSKVIPLVLQSDEYGMHTITEYQRENLASNIVIFVHDKFQGTMHDLSQGAFTVELNPNQEYRARFELVFDYQMTSASGSGTKGTSTSVDEVNTNGFNAFQQNQNLVVSNENGAEGFIQIFDISGNVLLEKNLNSNTLSVIKGWSKLASGTYILTVNTGKERLFTRSLVKL